MRTCPLYVSAWLLTAAMATAASAATDSQYWVTSGATLKLTYHWRVSEEITGRFSHNRDGLYELEINTLLGYRVSKVVSVWAGYTHDPQYHGGDFTVMEHRAREQVTFDKFANIGSGALSARIRTEQRWRNNIGGTAWRVRPFVRYSLPLIKARHIGLTITSEPFFNVNATTFQAKPGLDRVRNLVAITTPIGKRLTGEFGYMNQHIFIDRNPDESDNIAWLSISAAL